MLLAHRLNPVLAIFIVAVTALCAFFMIMHAISKVTFTSTAEYRAQQASANEAQ